MNFEVKKDGKVFLDGFEIKGYKSYSVDFDSIEGPEVILRFSVDDVNIEHLHNSFTQTEQQI